MSDVHQVRDNTRRLTCKFPRTPCNCRYIAHSLPMTLRYETLVHSRLEHFATDRESGVAEDRPK